MMETFEQKQQARQQRATLNLIWQAKFFARSCPAQKPSFLRRAVRILKNHPGSIAGDTAFILMLFFVLYVVLLLTGCR